jgi:hypothetical protein
MHSWHRAIISMLAIIGLLAALPGLVYIVGLAKVHGRPTPADPARFSQEAIAAAWQQCQETPPIAVQALNPWGFTGKFLFGNPLHTVPGERSAWRIASTHNVSHPVGNSLWWHTSGTALTIWITRHWSAEQIGATLARDSLCQ